MAGSPLPIAVLISGNGSNLQAIIDAIARGEVPAVITLVVSNNADAYGLERARRAGLPVRVLDHRDWPDRESYDRALMEAIDASGARLVVLAGFMRILSDPFVEHYRGRLLNIHPSLLPRYKGLDTHARVLAAGEREHGASVHFVTPALDDGPVIVQAPVPVRPGDTPETLAQRVHQVEHVIYPLAVKWFAEGRLGMDPEGNKVLWDGRPLDHPRQVRVESVWAA